MSIKIINIIDCFLLIFVLFRQIERCDGWRAFIMYQGWVLIGTMILFIIFLKLIILKIYRGRMRKEVKRSLKNIVTKNQEYCAIRS